MGYVRTQELGLDAAWGDGNRAVGELKVGVNRGEICQSPNPGKTVRSGDLDPVACAGRVGVFRLQRRKDYY